MKTQNVIAIAVAALVVGLVAGYTVASVKWERILEKVVVSSALYNLTSARVPLEFLSEGRTNRAALCLESELNGALQAIEIQADKFQRPDLRTNSSVVQARLFQEEQSEPQEQTDTDEDESGESAP